MTPYSALDMTTAVLTEFDREVRQEGSRLGYYLVVLIAFLTPWVSAGLLYLF